MPQTTPNCNTVLPNGKTIGDEVGNAVFDTQMAIASPESNLDSASALTSKMADYTFPFAFSYSPLDFKNRFRGQGIPADLSAAGNFAYAAYTSVFGGSSLTNFGARAYAQLAYATGLKDAKFMAPNGMDKSAAANVPLGLANPGCLKK